MCNNFTLVADGACSGNPGPGGWAYQVYEGAVSDNKVIATEAGGAAGTTNNIMELTATLKALAMFRDNGYEDSMVILHLDSQYVLDGIFEYMAGWKARGWRKSNGKPVLNVELWQEIDEVMTELRARGFSFIKNWVKGHAGDSANGVVDQMAVEQRDLYKPLAPSAAAQPAPAVPIFLDELQSSEAVRDAAGTVLQGAMTTILERGVGEDLGSALSAALNDTSATEAALKAVLDDYAGGLITVKGALFKIRDLRI